MAPQCPHLQQQGEPKQPHTALRQLANSVRRAMQLSRETLMPLW